MEQEIQSTQQVCDCYGTLRDLSSVAYIAVCYGIKSRNTTYTMLWLVRYAIKLRCIERTGSASDMLAKSNYTCRRIGLLLLFGMHGQAARRQWTDQPLFLQTNGRKADGVLATPLDASSRNKDQGQLRYHHDKYLILGIIPASIKEPARFTTNLLDLALLQAYHFPITHHVDTNPARRSKA